MRSIMLLRMKHKALLAISLAAFTVAAQARPFEDPRSDRIPALDTATANEPRDPGCVADQLASTGGPMPKNPRTLAIRWTGYSNFELVYNGQIVLLDAYFDRGGLYPSLGFKAADVAKANAILIGHGHFDHMSDAASVGARTGATIVGAPITTEKLATQAVSAAQVRTVTGRGGETFGLGSFTIEPILGVHGDPPASLVGAFDAALKATTKAPTPEQIAEQAVLRQRGTSDSRVRTEGTIAYLITLDNGFRIYYRDSAGRVTDFEKAAMARAGRVDVGLIAVSAAYLNSATIEQAIEHSRAYKPDVYIPAHHDAPVNNLWRATEPLFQALRDDNPNIVTVSKGYRQPICFNTDVNISKSR
ncbi:MAG TPA: MBL fold metallo-hydrolase [Xanthobacteraceae bacterium]|nr:MBL fold metallo-hydrolase [Xanthobacteraceae bacterium]